jgi:serine/threonine-protein kinase 10
VGNQVKDQREQNAENLKQILADISELPKAERADEKKRTKDQAATKHREDEAALLKQIALDSEQEMKDVDGRHKTLLAEKEHALLEREQEIVRENFLAERELGEQHLQERQQTLKHQLKATFWMQKHQMHYRHEKEVGLTSRCTTLCNVAHHSMGL